jgi:hypothetical protein
LDQGITITALARETPSQFVRQKPRSRADTD